MIFNLKFNLNQYFIDLSKANEIIIHCENKILSLHKEILFLDNSNKNLQSLIQKESQNNQVKHQKKIYFKRDLFFRKIKGNYEKKYQRNLKKYFLRVRKNFSWHFEKPK